MNSKWIKGLAAVAIVLLVVPAAFAQTTGRVDGIVSDDSSVLSQQLQIAGEVVDKTVVVIN